MKNNVVGETFAGSHDRTNRIELEHGSGQTVTPVISHSPNVIIDYTPHAGVSLIDI